MKIKNINKYKFIVFLRNIKNILVIIKRSSPSTVFWLVFCNIVSGATAPVQLFVWKYFIDSVTAAISTGVYRNSIQWLLALCLISIINAFISRLNAHFQKFQVDYLNKYISNIVMNKIAELDMSSYDNAEMYDIIERVNQESVPRSVSILTMIISFIHNITVLIGTVSVMMIFNPFIALLCCVSTVPMFFVSISISVKQYNIFIKRVQKLRFVEYIKSLNVKYENIKELKIYRAVPFLKNLMMRTYTEYLKEDKSIRKKFLKSLTITDIIQNVLSYVLKMYVLVEVVVKKRTLGDLTMYISSLDNLAESIRSILDSVASLYTDNLYIENLLSLIEAKPKMVSNSEKQFSGQFSQINFKNVSFKYPGSERYSLKEVNLTIEANKVYALVGLNGSGKTTLVKLLMRLYDPTEGDIFVDGVNLKEYELTSLYKKIGVIFQDFIKYPLNVSDNIGIGNIDGIHDSETIVEAARKSGADSFINLLPQKYNTLLQKEWDDGIELSLGQWQKIAISRAFTADAAILVLDEPSASLDPKSEYELFQHFKEMMPNKTCLLITHRFSNVRLADKIYVLKDGQLLEEGDHYQLIEKKGLYCELFDMQVSSYR